MNDFLKRKFSRREFIGVLGAAGAGIVFAPLLNSKTQLAYGSERGSSFLAQVGITQADNYNRALIKQKVQHLFESIGGIGDVVKAGNKLAIKINLTGGSSYATSSKLNGKSITETMWTHPEVLRAVTELIIDSGVSANDIYFVEAIWDAASYNNFGYLTVQQNLGVQMINLNSKAPYANFIEKSVGENKFFYDSFMLNKILADVDVYVSIPKMKQHYEAGVTHSLKNQIGIAPLQLYMQHSWDGIRSRLHFEGGDIGTHLPRSICDLNLARPVHLAVIDGIKNAIGGEGAWNPTFQTAESHVLLAGKDPVATDSIASFLMGNNPEAAKFQLPDGRRQCDNYLELLHQKGGGTNQLSEIEPVGDGAHLITAVRPEQVIKIPENIQLCQNFPNPFNSSTRIIFYLPKAEHVTINIYNVAGQKIETLLDSRIAAGKQEVHWIAKDLASGVYICEMRAGSYAETKKLMYQK